MIFASQWADTWVESWNSRDVGALIDLYADSIELRSKFAQVYANDPIVRGKQALETYIREILRRVPGLHLTRTTVHSGHQAIALAYRDNTGRNFIETFMFDDHDKVVTEIVCVDKIRA